MEGFENESQYVLEDAMPHRTFDFRFLESDSAGSFWSAWESEFAGVDPAKAYPFGSDGHYFLLIGENPSDPSDPLLFTVDHEEVYEAPYNPEGATVGEFLATLERSCVS